jgi:transcriptional regulator with XRE-family HTH domain
MRGDLERAVGRNLRTYWEDRGLSEDALAEVLGIDRTSLRRLEHGDPSLTLQDVERLAGRIGVDPLDLLRI